MDSDGDSNSASRDISPTNIHRWARLKYTNIFDFIYQFNFRSPPDIHDTINSGIYMTHLHNSNEVQLIDNDVISIGPVQTLQQQPTPINENINQVFI